ncbi:MAG: ABC transporter permease [Gammaproteobacteria bacterium]|nr:ABC transporter permease [Gammaproteobacteria bacterium]
MNTHSDPAKRVIVIEPRSPWGVLDWRELQQYVDLLYFMVWRAVKVSYAQSVGGFAWVIIQPVLQVIVFSLVFGGLLSVDTEGIPYPLLTTLAIIPWTYMSATMNEASGSLVGNAQMLAKIYFPRIIFLLTPVLSNLITFFVSLLLIGAVLVYYEVQLTLQVLYLPLVFLLMIINPLAISLWLASLAIRFRDVRIIMGYFMRMLIYLVPVMYPSSQIPAAYRSYYILNPFVGVIEGYRSCLLGEALHWDSLAVSAGVGIVLLLSGAVYFKRMERIIVDVV